MTVMNARRIHCICGGAYLLYCVQAAAVVSAYPPPSINVSPHLPFVGESALHILAPNLLEVQLITTKSLVASVSQWNFVSAQGALLLPGAGEFAVMVDGKMVPVTAVAFKRRPLYAPLETYDLRIANEIYLQLATPVADGQTVQVLNPDASLWLPSQPFTATADPLRFNPAIHVNQTGYVPAMPKKAMVGYYLGSLGELPVVSTTFQIVDATSGAVVYSGTLTPRPDLGYNYSPLPYQNVLQADFSAFTTPGEYLLVVPGLGASYPFFINDGAAAAFARTYALGLYSQRCGTNNALPYTRFTHDPCHTNPASVPSPQSQFAAAWNIIASYGRTLNPNNPPQTAPLLTNEAAQLFPFVNKGTVDVSGGHHDAGDYSKYTINSATLIHTLVFAADSLPGVGALDNLGLPESGDGRSDILQEAKWEADFLAKMQDADGGFYYLVYPRNREYENNVLPDHGDPQIVWPKNTAATAAAVAALAQCSSSPLFKAQFPQAASNYLAKAMLGWSFLSNAVAQYGLTGSYQQLIHYGDDFTHNDELAWAACEMYLATGNPQYQQVLFQFLPDPGNPNTFRWTWWRMYASYGNAIRSYAFAARSGRVATNKLDLNYLAKCEDQIVAAAQDQLRWSQQCAYGSSFPMETKQVRGAGWYFSMDQAFDLAVASALDDYPPLNDPRTNFLDAIWANMNYEGGCNPVNVSFVEGLGWRRQRDIVNQYAANDRRVLPPSGIPVGNIMAGFDYLAPYQGELGALCFPSEGAYTAPYPFYDRWGDSWNVQTEATIANQGRQLATAAFLMAKTSLATQVWHPITTAQITMPTIIAVSNRVTAVFNVPGVDLSLARIVWEAQNQEPAFGTNFTFTPVTNGPQWIEAEALWPGGTRAFAVTNFFSTNGSPAISVTATDPLAIRGTTNEGVFTFKCSSLVTTSLTVNYLLGGTAAKTVDYKLLPSTNTSSIVIPAGTNACTLSVQALGLPARPYPQTVVLTLVGGAGYNPAAPTNATVTLVNLSSQILGLNQAGPPGRDVTINWTSVPGFTYRVLARGRLTDTGWNNLSGDIIATATNTSWTDRHLAGVSQRFYAVQAATAVPPRIISFVPVTSILGNGLALNWASLPGQTYHVLFKNNLTDTNWTDLSGPFSAGSTLTSWTDIVSGTVTQRFFRVEQGQ